MLAVLRQRNFALLWFGGLVSMTGDWMLFIGLPIYVYQLSGSALATSLMFMAQIIPRILLGSVAGVYVDRWDRRRTLVIANLLLALGLLPLLLVRSLDWLWLVYVVAFAQSVVRQFSGPAENALLPTLVAEQDLLPANSLNTLNDNLARLIGPVLGGLAAAYLGLVGIALLDAASFAVAALMIVQIRSHRSPPPTPATEVTKPFQRGRAFWGEWISGLAIVARNPVLTAIFLWMAIAAVGEGIFGVLIVVFVNQIWEGGTVELGWLMSAQAVGGILGGLVVGQVARSVAHTHLIAFGSIVFGLLDLAVFNAHRITSEWWVVLLLMGLVGFPVVWTITAVQTLLQTAVADQYRGRVFGARGATVALLGLVGTVLAGLLGDRLPVVAVLNVQGWGYVLAGVLVFVLLRRALLTRSVSAPTHEAQAVRG